jgi:hypothetical protein
MKEARPLLNGADEAPLFRGLKLGKGVARSPLDNIVKKAPPPPRLNAEEAAALTRLKGLLEFDDAMRAAVAAIESNDRSLDAELSTLVHGTSARNAYQEIIDQLTAHGKAIVKDAACQLAWKQLAPNEANDINLLVTNRGYTVIPTSEVPGLWKQARDAAIDAIQGRAKSEFKKLLYPEELVNWVGYATGLYNKAVQLTQGGDQRIIHPNGYVTHAFIYYAKACLAPPGG